MSLGLFRTHVAEFTFECSGAGCFNLAFSFSDTEVNDLGFTFETEHDVLWAHVSVGDVERLAGAAVDASVCMIKASGDFFYDVDDLLHRELERRFFHFIENLSEVAALDVVHYEKELTLLYSELMNGNDIAMIEIDRNLRLVFEHVDEFWAVGVLWEDPLYRKKFADARCAVSTRKKHLGHAASGEFFQENVFAETFV